MANEILVKHGTPIVWADTTDYSDTVSGLARTDQIDLTSLGVGAAWQGAKADMQYKATALFPSSWLILAAFEWATAPAAGDVVVVSWAGSPSASAGNANPGGCSGTDLTYTGTAGSSIAASIKQLRHIGYFKATEDATTVVQYQTIGVLSDIPRYGMPVVYNDGADAFHSDAVEMYIAAIPLLNESQ